MNEFTEEQLNILRMFLLKQNNNKNLAGNNIYEKIEKARFYLEQEALDLDQMLLVFSAAKDEVDEFLKKKLNLNIIKPSGVSKILQNILKDAKLQTLNIKAVLETGELEN